MTRDSTDRRSKGGAVGSASSPGSHSSQPEPTSTPTAGHSDGRADVADERRVATTLLRRLSRSLAGRSAPLLVVLAVVAGVVTAGGLAPGLTERSPSDDPPPVTHGVAVTPVVLESGYDRERSYVGRVEARRESVLSFELDGLVDEVRFDEGDRVAAGEVVARLDVDVLRTERAALAARLEAGRAVLAELTAGPRDEVVAAARATVVALQARWELADRSRRRSDSLVRNGTVTDQTHDERRFAAAVAAGELAAARERLLELENGTRRERVAAQQATVAQLEAELATLDVRLAKSMLRAPYSGTIGGRFLDEGAVVTAGTSVVQLLETGRLDARVGVPGEVVASLERTGGHEVVVEGRSHPARLRASRPDRSATTRTVSLLFSLPVSDADVRVGDLAELRVRETVDESGVWIPVATLTESHRGLWACYVAVSRSRSDGTGEFVLERRDVEILHQEADRAFVRGTLADGELVVSSGVHRLVAGQAVRVVGPETRPREGDR